MTEELLEIFGFALLGVVILIPLKELKKEHFTIGIVALSLSLMLTVFKKSIPLFQYIKNMGNTELSGYFSIAFTSFGIAVITNIVSDMCKDFGAGEISGKIEFAGRIAIIWATLPLIETLMSMMDDLL